MVRGLYPKKAQRETRGREGQGVRVGSDENKQGRLLVHDPECLESMRHAEDERQWGTWPCHADDGEKAAKISNRLAATIATLAYLATCWLRSADWLIRYKSLSRLFKNAAATLPLRRFGRFPGILDMVQTNEVSRWMNLRPMGRAGASGSEPPEASGSDKCVLVSVREGEQGPEGEDILGSCFATQ